jgi:hypothetical protein
LVLGGDADENENKQGLKRWINQSECEQKLFFLGVFNIKASQSVFVLFCHKKAQKFRQILVYNRSLSNRANYHNKIRGMKKTFRFLSI